MDEVTAGGSGEPPDLVEMVEGMTYNVGSAVMALWRGDLRIAAWHVNREMVRLAERRRTETNSPVPAAESPVPETVQATVKHEPHRYAKIRIGRWDYEAEISPDGIASYENRGGDEVQAGPDRYKVLRWR